MRRVPLILLAVLGLSAWSSTSGANGQLCPEFCNCNGTARVEVDCRSQTFASVPNLQFSFNSNTTLLSLGLNRISDVGGNSFSHLPALRRLYLDQNTINNIHRDAFAGLQNLQLLSLASNRLTTLPHGVFRPLQSARNLYLHSNRLTTNTFTASLLRPLARTLNLLTLYGNNISRIQPGMFPPMPRLSSLYLSGNPITELLDGSFNGLTSLRVLEMASCDIQTIGDETFRNMTQLVKLDLSYNELVSVDRHLFVDLINLRELHLQFNSIASIDDGSFFRLSSLQSLFLQSNHLTEVRPGMLSGLFALIRLWMDRNRIARIHQDTFQNLARLRELYLHVNRLTSLAHCQFRGATNLEILVLRYNQISCMADGTFCCLPHLSRLYLGVNRVVMITPGMLECMSSVQRLSIYGNRISFVAGGSFQKMTALTELVWDYPTDSVPSDDAFSNNLTCDCNAIYFSGFIQQFPSITDAVRCASPSVLRPRLLNTVHHDSLNCTEDVAVTIGIDSYRSPTAFRLSPPATHPATMETIVVPRGHDLHLTNEAKSVGLPTWNKDGSALVARDCGMVTPHGDLALTAMTNDLEGLYTLVLHGTTGAAAHSVFITAGESPRIVVPPRDVEMQHPGRNVMLTCVATGTPTPTTYWMKDGERLNTSTSVSPNPPHSNESVRFIVTDDSLHILNTMYSDGGFYTCVATNGIGEGDRREAEIFFRRATPCSPSCRNNGTCTSRDVHSCKCPSTYTGVVCQTQRASAGNCDLLTGECHGDGSGSGAADLAALDGNGGDRDTIGETINA